MRLLLQLLLHPQLWWSLPRLQRIATPAGSAVAANAAAAASAVARKAAPAGVGYMEKKPNIGNTGHPERALVMIAMFA